jgi:hypothetical protein
MAKIIVVIENTEDGQPIWDEASIKQLHDIIRPGTKPNHHGEGDDYGDVLVHYSSHSSHERETDDGDNSGASAAATSDTNRDLAAGFIEYVFEA